MDLGQTRNAAPYCPVIDLLRKGTTIPWSLISWCPKLHLAHREKVTVSKDVTENVDQAWVVRRDWYSPIVIIPSHLFKSQEYESHLLATTSAAEANHRPVSSHSPLETVPLSPLCHSPLLAWQVEEMATSVSVLPRRLELARLHQSHRRRG
ncbi:hypothetical protein POX_a00216 [Penicillium oxalicum]|uniref:Uncharacterized protein n=1 Tax=Penicillium oxalicum (strain 114-2 / CGMCC 5302) TaxID=933388 RepID=S8BHW3_PENO1|nr:hypothetical protein POX_a00216 [Penicillium oxalicum]EPS34817.1 hypothetical protein PDE_09781 [Penicillium oxalicum 114-2]KAI2793633.1 hypothetical protein POX_a00216 [Penicillium oxalicum]